MLKATTWIALVILIACGCGGGGDSVVDTSGESAVDGGSSTRSVTLSGNAELPNYTPSGPLWLFVDGLDGYVYGEGPSDLNGDFSLEIEVPTDMERVLLYAVDPDDPEHYAMAYVELDTVNDAGSQLAKSLEDHISMHVQLTANDHARAMVSQYSGLWESQFSSAELELVSEIEAAIEGGTCNPRLCTNGTSSNRRINELLVDYLINNPSNALVAVLDPFDAFVNGSGDLKSRVKNAQDYVSANVRSLNQVTDNLAPILPFHKEFGQYIPGFQPLLGLLRTRSMLDIFKFGYSTGYMPSSTTRSRIEAAASIIMNAEWGNCEENAYMGAYIGSRFEEFKQVALVSMVSTRSFEVGRWNKAPHAFAVACKNGEAIYDINRLYTDHLEHHDQDTEEILDLHDDFDDAECYLIDPWLEKVELLTKAKVKTERGWMYLRGLMKVDVSANSDPEEIEVEILPNRVSPYSDSEESLSGCMSSEEISKVCTPFTIPERDTVPPDDTPDGCETPPTTATGESGRYYYVKHWLYPMPDSSSCFTAQQIADFESVNASEGRDIYYIREDESRGSCTICPAGFTLGNYEGSETCMQCPEGWPDSDGCCP
jgi:hypothetical protein